MYAPIKRKGPHRNLPKFTGKMRFRIGDVVRVISGKDAGKEGKITQVIPTLGKVVIEGVNIVTKHQKPRQQGSAAAQSQQTGRIEMAAPIHICKVQLIDPAKSEHVTRIGIKTNADGSRVRYAKKSGGVIENAS